MAFRLAAKAFFLTYPRCDATHQSIIDVLETNGRAVHYIISSELHADGTPHRHVYVRYNKTINVKSPNFFDVLQHHGNYQTVKNAEATKTYVKKDKQFTEWQQEVDNESLLDKCKSMNETEFFEHCASNKLPIGYYNEAKRLCSDYFTITDEIVKGTITNPNPNLS